MRQDCYIGKRNGHDIIGKQKRGRTPRGYKKSLRRGTYAGADCGLLRAEPLLPQSHIQVADQRFSHAVHFACRLYKAKKMLVETDESVTDAGYDCGYTDTAYFIRQSEAVRESAPGSPKSVAQTDGFRQFSLIFLK